MWWGNLSCPILLFAYYPHMPIGMLGIYRLQFVFLSFCLSFCPQDFGNGYLGRGLTYGCEILQDGRSRSPPGHLSFWWTLAQGLAKLAPPRPKSEKSIMHWTVVSQLWQTGRAVATSWSPLAVTAISMWGLCQSGQLAYLFYLFFTVHAHCPAYFYFQFETSLPKVIWEEGRVAWVSHTRRGCGQHA